MASRFSIPIKLDHPVAHDGRTYDNLVLHSASVGDVLDSSEGKNAQEQEVILVARMARVPVEVIRQIDYDEDYEPKIAKALRDFQSRRKKAGTSGGESSSSPASPAGGSPT